MAYPTDNGQNSSSTRSGGSGATDPLFLQQSSAMTKPPAQASISALNASSSSNYASSVSSGGGIPGTPMSRRSGGWDRQTLSPAAAARARDDPSVEDNASERPSSQRPRDDEESSDSSDEYVTSYKPLQRASTRVSGSRSKRFFQNFVRKLTNKSSVRYGFVPNSQEEQDRNVIQHAIIVDIFRGHLHLSPIPPNPRRVLDIGTASGTWALEFAQKHPYCSVIGVDIEPIKPPFTRSNCSFMTMDITHDWDFNGNGHFDFIHVRQLGDIQDKRKLIQSTMDNLKPGGWVEFTEWIAVLQSPNHSLDGTAFRKWNDLLEEGLRNFGTTLWYPNHFKPLLYEAGFEHVIETRNGATTNACYPGKKLQRIGHLMTQNWLLILEPLTMPVFTQALGWTPEEVRKFLVDVRKEIGNTKYHSFMTLITFCAQKPLNSGSTSFRTTSASASASQSSLHGPPAGPDAR